MNPHLFVYGSLMSTAGQTMGARLGAEARPLGPATMQGRLYRVSWYPGLADSDDAAHRVHGEVYALHDPQRSFTWLDDYEGITTGNPEDREYARVERPVLLGTGQETVAWVYLYRKDVSGLALLPDGRWPATGSPQ
jgi:gamma-glutamylcyclotransferase (GGCT)/AIG2-like uncharacterized protein YtfP